MCRSCGEVVDPRRVELGYDYCLKQECQQRCLKRVRLAAVGVNKAADYYSKAEEVLPPRPATSSSGAASEDDEIASTPDRRNGRASTPKPTRRRKTALERLREQEVALDASLDRSYERFRGGEITSRELERERDRLIGDFNRAVMSENIRYRSMLRGRANGTR